MFHKGTRVKNVVIYLSMFFNISGGSDDHFLFIYVSEGLYAHQPLWVSLENWHHKTLWWTDVTHYWIFFPSLAQKYTHPVVLLCSPDVQILSRSRETSSLSESSSWSSHPGIKNLQALELFFPNYLSSSGEQDGEIPTQARTLYHLGPKSIRKAWGIDPHPQRHWKIPSLSQRPGLYPAYI